MALPNACPACGKPISYRQIVAGAEKYAIRCRNCSARLSKRTRTLSFVVAALFALWRLENTFGMWSWQYGVAVVVTLAVSALLAWVTVRVTLAPDDMQDQPSLTPPKFETSDAPPPLDPTFRGMSGPPPKREAD